jgi:hypothetical protein
MSIYKGQFPINFTGGALRGSLNVDQIYQGGNIVYGEVSAPVFVGLLDDYPNASLAYSVRKLRSDYTGSCITVRRSNDDTTQDIGFVDNELDTTSLTNFVGANDGFVTKWWDQSGNAFDATESTNANQPQIVSSGTIITIGSKPALQSGTNTRMDFTTVNLSRHTHLMVAKKLSSTSNNLVGLTGTANPSPALIHFNDDNIYFQWFENYIVTNAVVDNIDYEVIIASTTSATTATMARNGSTLASTRISFPTIPTAFDRMLAYGGQPSLGRFQELIAWDSELDASFNGIQTNVNDYYSIY